MITITETRKGRGGGIRNARKLCGKQFPHYVMDLDHRDPNEKVAAVAAIINRGSWRLLLAEIEKCDIVCANCHRERTHGKEQTT